MKIIIPFSDRIYKKISERVVEKTLRALDYKLYYEAYKKYVLDTEFDVLEKLVFDTVDTPKVSIIIPVYNQYALTIQCLNTIKLNAGINDYEIIIIDDCSTDETVNIKDSVSGITVIRNEVNLGFLGNCNKAAKIARGKYIYLLNNDTKLLEGAIKELVEILDADQTVGAVGSKLIYPDGKINEAGSSVIQKAKVRAYGSGCNPLEDEYNYIKEVDYCCGASLMVRKNLWDDLNGFDERFSPGYYEETDLCFRIREKGFKVLYQPKSEVIHLTGQTFSERAKVISRINRAKFYKKWKKVINSKRKKI